MENFCIAVTGLPGSGKSTIGRVISEKLQLPFLDKDKYLERLFEEKGIGDLKWRQELSRESDELFKQDAESHKSAVLVSHWRPRGSTSNSGTPVEWLEQKYSQIIELYCECSVEEAAKRFIGRVRHQGHQDRLKSNDEIREWLSNYNKLLPLSLGMFESIDTSPGASMDNAIWRLCSRVQSNA